MSDLTDLELCKRIVEIEGECIDFCTDSFVVVHNGGDGKYYNPLTDDALCFQLMVKYKVDIEHFKCGTVSTYIDDSVHGEVIEINVNRAILLAIIEANNNG